jgi:predicted O-linked N-acetylglucosamine transferase (SPINDLY family)
MTPATLNHICVVPPKTEGELVDAPAAVDVAALWQQLALSPIQATVWLALARCYAGQSLLWQAGYTARQALRMDATLGPALNALKLTAWQDVSEADALLGRSTLPDAAVLAKRFAVCVAACPGDWLSWLYLARIQEISALPQSRISLQQSQTVEPIAGESLHWMGVWRLAAGDVAGAVTAFSDLLEIRPVRFGSMMLLGEALLRNGNFPAAEKAFARASLSNNPDFLGALAAKVFLYNYWMEALEVLQKAIAIKPESAAIALQLAKIYWEVYELSKAREWLRRVQVLEPGNQDAAFLMIGLPGRMGDASRHFVAVQAAYTARKDPMSRLASSVAMVSLYLDEMRATEVAHLHRRLCAPIEAAYVPRTEFSNLRVTGRRLRIGYVTGDLHRQHPVNIFMLPVLLRHDHARFEIFIYHTGAMHDGYTHQSIACADHWLEASKVDDSALQQVIVSDQIDVLIDLAGHTASHRLGVFAMRAAPVQATFLGYPHSTGLSSIDWLVGDAVVSPQEHSHLYSEGIAQLPGSVFCWASVDDYAMPPPRPAQAPVVFGSFNNAMKLSPTTIALWARVLQAVPGSLLLLKAPSLRDEEVKARFVKLFAAQGIGSERLIFRGPTGLAEMMQEYGDMDIALDPTPYNGGTTTLQALWMGVPVVALAGNNFVGRMGASFLKTLGYTDWLAQDADGYVAAAVRLAQDCQSLRRQRAQMRQHMAASPLCDIATYVRNFETLLKQMWVVHCRGQAQRVIEVTAE